MKKTSNESRTKNTFSGTVHGAGCGVGGAARQALRARRFVLLRGFDPKNEGFHPKTPNPTIFHQNQVYTTSPHLQLHPITSIHTIDSRLVII